MNFPKWLVQELFIFISYSHARVRLFKEMYLCMYIFNQTLPFILQKNMKQLYIINKLQMNDLMNDKKIIPSESIYFLQEESQ